MLRNTRNTSIILLLIITSVMLFSQANELFIFNKDKKKTDTNSSLTKSKIQATNVSPNNYKHSLEIELSKTVLSHKISKQLPSKSCFLARSSNNSDPIISFNTDSQLIPGSTIKLLTAAIVFSHFKKDETLDTSLYGEIAKGNLKNAVLTTSGDPSFISDNKPDLARLDYLEPKYTHKFDELANAVAEKKITNIDTLTIDNSWFELKAADPQWEDKASQVGALGALLVNEGYKLNGVSSNPQSDASEILKAAFAQQSINISKIVFADKPVDKDLVKNEMFIASAKSATIENLVSDMLKTSNNIYAEQLLIASAHKLNDKVNSDIFTTFKNDEIQKILLKADGIKYLNASGFSYASTISCSQELEVINYANKNNIDLISLSSKAFEDGTLKERFSAYKDKLQAKTGTLDNVSSLVGNIENKQFALIVNGQFGSDQGHSYQEDAIALLDAFPSVKDLKL